MIHAKQQQAFEKETLERLEHINTLLNSGDLQKVDEYVNQLYNGNLEQTMNTLLQTVNPQQHQRIATLLNSYRYSPIQHSENEAEIKVFFAQELQHLTAHKAEGYGETSHAAGTELFAMVRQFMKRFAQQKENLQAFELLDFIIKASQELLTPSESLALRIISKYLKAEKMFT
ncbi:MAG: hypothetical protein LBG52_03620 [Candidatus Peribacteria bacterium]|jgi:hypothetical protein|nr:hypothetical protein [Candidatus Peribacteria bacterium]